MNNEQVYDSSKDQYEVLEQEVIKHFNNSIKDKQKLFKVNVQESLFNLYIDNLPEESKQHYTCNACKHFINRFGSLVTIDDTGSVKSAVWNIETTPSLFISSVKAMKKAVENARVNDVFLSDVAKLGIPKTGEWSHLHVVLPKDMLSKNRLKTDSQLMAEKREEFGMLNRALLKYDLETINQAVTILESDSLYRGDRFLGIAVWFQKLQQSIQDSRSTNKNNLTWATVANAPNGFCHISSSMIGTLLDDIAEGMDFDSINRRFQEKMNPSSYMRSQSAPTQGGIAQAEKLIEKLGLQTALNRRYARREEIPSFLWESTGVSGEVKQEKKSEGVFGHITPKNKTSVTVGEINLPSTVMTWDKFQRTLLNDTVAMEALYDNPNRSMAIITASDETAENILQWNNPFSWYYHSGVDGEIRRRVEAAGGRYEDNDIRCSLIWENFTDLDIHCETPLGSHIYYRNKKDRSGGNLDIDMNAGTGRSESPVENIRWPKNSAPSGYYKFYVHNFNERASKKGTAFKVELEVAGKIYHYYGDSLQNRERITVFQFNYHNGVITNFKSNAIEASLESPWGINSGSFVKVNGITTSPNTWGQKNGEHHYNPSGEHIFFILDGLKDTSEGKGRGFFTEMLKPELREIRKTLDAYTAGTPIENAEEATACGLGFNKENNWDLTLKVTLKNGSTRLIKIDRID